MKKTILGEGVFAVTLGRSNRLARRCPCNPDISICDPALATPVSSKLWLTETALIAIR
jgi:hypothetical protein